MHKHFWTLLAVSFLAATSSSEAHADWAAKLAALKCDPTTNRALIQLDILNKDTDPTNVQGPRLTGELAHRYADLARRKAVRSCMFHNGRTVAISYSEGRLFARGAGGADPDAYVTLRVSGKAVLHNYKWYAGYGEGNTNSSLIVLDKDKVFICAGPGTSGVDIHKFEASLEGCKNVMH